MYQLGQRGAARPTFRTGPSWPTLEGVKIAMVLHSGVGGSGVVATELGSWLARNGHEVHLVAAAVPFRLGDDRVDGVYFHQIASMTYPLFDAPLTTLAEASKIVEVVEQFGIDVVHAHYAVPHALAALVARAMVRDVPPPAVVTTLHGTDVTLVGLDRAYLRVTQWSIESSDVVTAVSRYLTEATVREMGVRRSDIRVVPNAVDVERFTPAARRDLRPAWVAPGERLLAHVSNFRQVKRTADVVRIFAKVAAAVPARLVMVGDGPEHPTALALAHELGVADRVSFVGSYPRLEPLLANADLFLLPSSQESFGLSALEAMASGVPVVASAVGGVPEVVEDGSCGFLHEVGDVDAMAASALRLLRDDAEHARFAQAARRRAETAFDEATVFPAYVQAYEDALARVRE